MDHDWLAKFNRECNEALDCDHAEQYLTEITVLADPHAMVRCANCGKTWEIKGTRWIPLQGEAM